MIITLSNRYQDRSIQIIKAPSPADFEELRREVGEGPIRALIDAEKNFYVWDGRRNWHAEVITKLSIDQPVRLLFQHDTVYLGWGRREPPPQKEIDREIVRVLWNPTFRSIFPGPIILSYPKRDER